MATLETGRLITEIRKKKNMTQKDVANYLNVSDRAVSKWERGESYPEITTLPKLAELLEISVDELLRGSIENKDLKNDEYGTEDINKEERKRAYSCLLEDAGNKFHRSTIITYLILAIGALIYLHGDVYNVSQIISIILGLSGIVFYYFSIYDYRVGVKRFGYYFDIDNQKDRIKNQIKHSSILIVVELVILILIITNSFIQASHFMEKYNKTVIVYCSYPKLTILIMLGIIIANLYSYCMACNKESKGNSLKNNNKLKTVNIIITLISVLSSLILMGYKLYMMISFKKYNVIFIEYLIIGLAVFIILSNILVLKLFIKEKILRYFPLVIASLLEFGILVFNIYKSINFPILDQGYKNKTVIIISSGNLLLSVLVVITIYHLMNLFILKNKLDG